jgi:hypothetical protein
MFFNQQLAALQQHQQQAAAALLLRPPENTPQQPIVPAAPQTPARQIGGAEVPHQALSPMGRALRETARRNLEEQEALRAARETAAQALREARSPPARPLPDLASGIQAEGEIDELEIKDSEKVFSRAGVMYVQRGDKFFRVVQTGTEPERPASETGAKKKGRKTSAPLNFEPSIQTRRQKEEEQRRREEENVELWSVNLQNAQNDRLSQIESQIELLAISVKEGMAAAKALSRKGAASRDSSQTRERNPSRGSERSRGSENPSRGSERTRGSDRTRTESYKRGEVREGRYTSRERRDYSHNRTSAGESRNYSANRQNSERGRSLSSGQRGREQSRSPYRQQGSSSFTSERKSRRDDRSGSRGRERSIIARQTYPKMKKGENCSLDYDPLKMKSCSKCGKPGHHEFECYKYERYSTKKCSVCDRLHHFAGDCKELEKFPPKGKELNSSELLKNY